MHSLLLGSIAMGRSFGSISMAVKDLSARWLKASKALANLPKYISF